MSKHHPSTSRIQTPSSTEAKLEMASFLSGIFGLSKKSITLIIEKVSSMATLKAYTTKHWIKMKANLSEQQAQILYEAVCKLPDSEAAKTAKTMDAYLRLETTIGGVLGLERDDGQTIGKYLEESDGHDIVLQPDYSDAEFWLNRDTWEAVGVQLQEQLSDLAKRSGEAQITLARAIGTSIGLYDLFFVPRVYDDREEQCLLPYFAFKNYMKETFAGGMEMPSVETIRELVESSIATINGGAFE